MATDLTIQRGDRSYLDVALSGVDAATVAAASFTFTAKRSVEDPDAMAVLRKTSASGAITATAGQAAVAIRLDAIDTAGLPWPAYRRLVYDLQMTPVDGTGPFTVVVGQLLLTPDVSLA